MGNPGTKFKPGITLPWQNVTVELVKLASILIENHPEISNRAIITFDSVAEEVRLQDKTQTVLIDQISYQG